MSEQFSVSVTHRADGSDPDPKLLLAEAIGSCLAASLHFCLTKAHIEVEDVSCVVEGETIRNDRGRQRLGELRVRVSPRVDPADLERSNRCLELFESFCTVTESVRAGIDVIVEVAPIPTGEPTAA